MMVSVRKVLHDGVCQEGPESMVSVRKVLHDGIC